MARSSRRARAGSPGPKSRPRPKGPWKHGPIPVIGLIGGIGAGKSKVARLLADHGALVLDADAIGHALLDQRPARELVVRRFGQGVLDTTVDPPRVNRLALGALVFGKPEALRALEAILHPRMRKTFEKAIARTVRQRSAPAVVLDAAVLLKAGWNDLCDTVVFVDTPREQRLARLAAQRGWTAETLDSRERAQTPLEEAQRRADHVIANNADAEALQSAVNQLWQTLVKPAANRPPAARGMAGTSRRAPSPRSSPP